MTPFIFLIDYLIIFPLSCTYVVSHFHLRSPHLTSAYSITSMQSNAWPSKLTVTHASKIKSRLAKTLTYFLQLYFAKSLQSTKSEYQSALTWIAEVGLVEGMYICMYICMYSLCEENQIGIHGYRRNTMASPIDWHIVLTILLFILLYLKYLRGSRVITTKGVSI